MVISFLRDEVGNECNISWKKDTSLQNNEHCVLFEDTLHRWMSCFNLLLFLKRYDSTFKTLYFIISIIRVLITVSNFTNTYLTYSWPFGETKFENLF